MRFTAQLERRVLTSLRSKPTACITFPDGMYRDDGSILIYRDNLTHRLHRWLYVQVIGDLPRSTYLLPACSTRGCMNPHHYDPSSRPQRGRVAATCPNGHRYTATNTLSTGRRRCRKCRDAYNDRRRKTKRRRGYCREGHELADGNVYVSTDVRGREHRRCRRCTLARTRLSRRNERREP